MLFAIYSIGFLLSSEESLGKYIEYTLRQGQRIKTGLGEYACYHAPCGAELWVKLDLDGQILGINPYYSGNAEMQVGLIERIPASSGQPLDGAFRGWANPQPADPPEALTGEYTFAFNVPNFAMYTDLSLPSIQPVRLTGFARELAAFENEDQFRHQQQSSLDAETRVESFSPSRSPDSWVDFTGRVLDSARLTNDLTGFPFYWAWVETLGGQMDIVTLPDNLRGELVPGGVVRGSIWLSGKPI